MREASPGHHGECVRCRLGSNGRGWPAATLFGSTCMPHTRLRVRTYGFRCRRGPGRGNRELVDEAVEPTFAASAAPRRTLLAAQGRQTMRTVECPASVSQRTRRAGNAPPSLCRGAEEGELPGAESTPLVEPLSVIVADHHCDHLITYSAAHQFRVHCVEEA